MITPRVPPTQCSQPSDCQTDSSPGSAGATQPRDRAGVNGANFENIKGAGQLAHSVTESLAWLSGPVVP